MHELRANTEVKVRIGPATNYKNGREPITTLTLAGADQAELLKHNGIATVDISGNTMAAIAGADGWYDLTLTAGNLDTEGTLTVLIQDEDLCLPVFIDYLILSQAAWDSKYVAKDTGYIDVNVRAISDDTTAADNCEKMFDGTGYAGGSTPLNVNTTTIEGSDATDQIAASVTVPSVEAIADAVWDEVLTGATHNIASSAGRRLRQIAGFAIREDTAQGGAACSITLDAGASATDGIYVGHICVLTEGTGAGQARTIVDYDGSSKIACVSNGWETQPDATTGFQLLASYHIEHISHGKAQAAGSGYITLEAGESSTTDIYKNALLHLITNTGAGQCRLITGYNGITKVATVTPDWTVTPDNTTIYHIDLQTVSNVALIEGADATAQINAECDTALSDYDAPTKGELDTAQAAIQASVGSSETNVLAGIGSSETNVLAGVGSSETNVLAGVTASEGNLTTEIDANEVLLNTINAAIAGVSTTTIAAIFGEALSGHTSSGTFGEAINHIHKILKNRWRINNINNTLIFYDDDGTTPLFTFNLKDFAGIATSTLPAEREPT